MFYPVHFSNYDDAFATMFDCPSCQAANDVVLPWSALVPGSPHIEGAKSQFGPIEYTSPLMPGLKQRIDIPLNICGHIAVACPSCTKTVTVYLDGQAGGRHGEMQYIIAAVKVGEGWVLEGLKSPPPKRVYPIAPAFDPKGPAFRFLSEVWFNGWQWELSCPEGWGTRRHGAHEFSNAYGALLRLGVAGRGTSSGPEVSPPPLAEWPAHEKDDYRSARIQADNWDRQEVEIKRYELGALTGFAYRAMREDLKFAWYGWFGDPEHFIYVNLSAPPENEAYCMAAVRFMLASLRFHATAVGEPSAPRAAADPLGPG